MSNVSNLFRKHQEDFCLFDKIKSPMFSQADVCGLVFLAIKFPRNCELIVCADETGITLSIDKDDIETLSEDDVIFLTRCGFWYDEKYTCLNMEV